MNRKAMIENCVQYILGQDHEREDLVDRMANDVKEFKRQGMTLKQIRLELYDQRENSIYYIASVLAHGKHYANVRYRSCMADALEKLR
jgi:Asp-tRNA(Asn)/Glu-tRNA(Gln) amidotransferase A subunit family amidase